MNIEMHLAWSEGDPAIIIDEAVTPVRVTVDPRLSRDQVLAACAQLDGAGDAVFARWQDLVGSTDLFPDRAT